MAGNRRHKMRSIFTMHTSSMELAEDVIPHQLITSKDDLSDADIKAMCTEAGLLALRERRMRVTMTDFEIAKELVLHRKEGDPESEEEEEMDNEKKKKKKRRMKGNKWGRNGGHSPQPLTRGDREYCEANSNLVIEASSSSTIGPGQSVGRYWKTAGKRGK